MNYNTIIFDLDGTLIDSAHLIMDSFNYALEPFRITLSPQKIEGMRSMTSNELFQDILNKAQAQEALARLWDYAKQSASKTILIPGIKSLLEKITLKNLKLALWTGRDRASALSILQYHQIEHYFEKIVGGCEVINNKPHPDGLLMLAQYLNVPLTSMIHVGDHDHDLQGAHAVGVTAIHAKWCVTEHLSQHAHLAGFSFETIDMFSAWIDKTT